MKEKDLKELKRAYITTYLYEYTLKDVEKAYRKLINKQNEIIYKLGNSDREELIYKYTKELYIDDVYVYNN